MSRHHARRQAERRMAQRMPDLLGLELKEARPSPERPSTSATFAVRMTRIPVAGGRELRVARWTGEDGTLLRLSLALAFEDDPLHAPPALDVPGDVLPALRAALEDGDG